MKGAIPAGYPAYFFEMIEQANQSAITDTNMGFIFDATPVQNEVAACSAVVDEFTLDLTFGYIERRTGTPALTSSSPRCRPTASTR